MEIASGVSVSYADEFQIWTHIATEFSSRLPLQNVEWKAGALPAFIATAQHYSSNRTTNGDVIIPKLDLNMQKLSTENIQKGGGTLGVNSNRRQVPYLNIYLVHCDDVEVYAKVVKKQIQSWVDIVSSRRNQEWLILHVTKDRLNNPRFLIRTTVYDKIRGDFNSGRRDRCAQVSLETLSDTEMWQDVFTKIVDGIFFAFGISITQVNEDLKRLDAQKALPGFNYCNFFILKEGLALMFESMSLYGEALLLYDELEVAFFECLESSLQKGAMPWSHNFGGVDPMDDCANILSFDKKLYQEMLAQNSISVFDFRSYLFARQMHMLMKLEKPFDICIRGKMFITGFSIALLERKETFHSYFVECWLYSASIQLFRYCENHFRNYEENNPKYIGILAELLFDARKQVGMLDKLGFVGGYLSHLEPFEYVSLKTQVDDHIWATSSQELLEILKSEETFLQNYIKLTKEVLKRYQSVNSFRTVYLLHADIASLYFYSRQWKVAAESFQQLLALQLPVLDNPRTNQYTVDRNHTWNHCDVDFLSKLAECYWNLEVYDQYLLLCILLVLHGKLLSKSAREHYSKQLREFGPTVISETVINIDMSLFFEASLARPDTKPSNFLAFDDGREVLLKLVSQMSNDINVQSAELTMHSQHNSEILFINEGLLNLSRGLNLIPLYCGTHVPAGNYVAGQLALKIGCIVFQTSFIEPYKPKLLFKIHETIKTVSIRLVESPEYQLTAKSFELSSLNVDKSSEIDKASSSTTFEPDYYVIALIETSDYELLPNTSLSIQSSSGLAMKNGGLCLVKITESDGQQKEQISNLQNGKLYLPAGISMNSFVSIRIPVEDKDFNAQILSHMIRGLDPADVSKTFQVRANFDYLTTKGSFILSNVYDIKLYSPIFASFSLHYPSENTKHICLRLRCHEDSPPIFIRNINSSMKLIYPVKDELLFPRQYTNFIFDLLDDTNETHFTVEYCKSEEIFLHNLVETLGEIVQESPISSFEIDKDDVCRFLAQFIYNVSVPSESVKKILLYQFSIYKMIQLSIVDMERKEFGNSLFLQPRSWWKITQHRLKAMLASSNEDIQTNNQKFISELAKIIHIFYENHSNIYWNVEKLFNSYNSCLVKVQIPPVNIIFETEVISPDPNIDIVLGSFMQFQMKLSSHSLKNLSQGASKILVELKYDPECWIVAGRMRFSIQLDDQQIFPFLATPLKLGMIQQPEVHIKPDLEPNTFFVRNVTAGKQILVKPRREMTTFWINQSQVDSQAMQHSFATALHSLIESKASRSAQIFSPAAMTPRKIASMTTTPRLGSMRPYTTANSVSNTDASNSTNSLQPATSNPLSPIVQNSEDRMDTRKWGWLSPAALGDQLKEKMATRFQRRDTGQWKRARKLFATLSSPTEEDH